MAGYDHWEFAGPTGEQLLDQGRERAWRECLGTRDEVTPRPPANLVDAMTYTPCSSTMTAWLRRAPRTDSR
ncbi:MAG: hypothetical protein ACRCYX_13935 [Dermatophilaceae bacterium]